MKRIIFAIGIVCVSFFISPWVGFVLLIPLFYFFPFFYEGLIAWSIIDVARTIHTSMFPEILMTTLLVVVIMHLIEFLRPSLRVGI